MLVNPCNYSFRDLLNTVFKSKYTQDQINTYLQNLYNLSQYERNNVVKYLCKEAHWYFEDIKGSDGIIYTAFSPEKV